MALIPNDQKVLTTKGSVRTIESGPASLKLQNEWYTMDDIKETVEHSVKPYKVYTALLSQFGTNAPTANVLENTFDITPNWIRKSQGFYKINEETCALMGIDISNSVIFISTSNNTIRDILGLIYDDGDGAMVELVQFTRANGASADGMGTISVEIRVYN